MKHFTLLLPLALYFGSGAALAAEPQNTSQPAPTTKDHSQMGRSHADHGQTKREPTPDDFAKLDVNKDGTLSKAELAKHRLGPHFGMLDTNRDGKLTQVEFSAGQGM